jgi:hypothetical protein
MAKSLWPDFSTIPPPVRGLREMIFDAAGDIDVKTNGALQLYIDTLGVSGVIEKVRHNCYLRVVKTRYTHLLFRVSAPVPGPWPATVSTPEGEKIENINTEQELRDAVQQIFQRQRTTEVVLYLLSTVR